MVAGRHSAGGGLFAAAAAAAFGGIAPVDLAKKLQVGEVELRVVVPHAVAQRHALSARVRALAQLKKVAIGERDRLPRLAVVVQVPAFGSHRAERLSVAVRAEHFAYERLGACILLKGLDSTCGGHRGLGFQGRIRTAGDGSIMFNDPTTILT